MVRWCGGAVVRWCGVARCRGLTCTPSPSVTRPKRRATRISSISVSTRYAAKFCHARASIETNWHDAAGADARATLSSVLSAVTSIETRRKVEDARRAALSALAVSMPTLLARWSMLPCVSPSSARVCSPLMSSGSPPGWSETSCLDGGMCSCVRMICCSMESVVCPPGVVMRFMPSRLFSLRVSGCGTASCPPRSRSPCVSTAGRHDGRPCAAAPASEEPEDRLRQVRQGSSSRRRDEVGFTNAIGCWVRAGVRRSRRRERKHGGRYHHHRHGPFVSGCEGPSIAVLRSVLVV